MKLSKSLKKINIQPSTLILLCALLIMTVIIYFINLKSKEGFKAFDNCKNGSYPFEFCINIPFNSEGLYQSWDELEDNMRNYNY